MRIPEGIADEQVVFLSDIFPTGYMGSLSQQRQPVHRQCLQESSMDPRPRTVREHIAPGHRHSHQHVRVAE